MIIDFEQIQVGGGVIPPGYSRTIITNKDRAILDQLQVSIIKSTIKDYIERFGSKPLLFKLVKV